ncbi:MAG: hypothetical protein E6G94_03230 [Alphaproteobacteria bacterium]|nr:MAG: hypothetical protein E6G94_03230 [Alphaproteobacteria bacterium]
MMLIELALAAAMAAQGAPERQSPPPPEATLRHFEACGAGQVSSRYDPDMREDIVEIAALPEATDEQLRCLVDTSLTDARLVSVTGSAEQRYRDIESAVLEERMLARARAWASERGLLDRVPHYAGDKEDDDIAFARKLEALCGRDARGAFHGHRLNIEWARRMAARGDPHKTADCLINVAILADFGIGIVGNEAFGE